MQDNSIMAFEQSSIILSRVVRCGRRGKTGESVYHCEYWDIAQKKYLPMCRSNYMKFDVVEDAEINCERCLNYI